MALNGKEIKDIQEALLSAFPSKDSLRMMVRIELDENLDAIVDGENLRVLIFNLVTWAERTGCIDELMQGAYNTVPGNPVLQKLVKAQGGTKAPPSPPAVGISVRVSPVSIDVFLSYSRKDRIAMNFARDVLRNAGLSVWTDEGLEPGTHEWQTSIAEAVIQSEAMVVLLSPNALASTWVNREINYAQIHAKRIFPVLIAGDQRSSVPITLSTVQWVDGRQDLRLAMIQELQTPLLRQMGRSAPAPEQTKMATPPPLAAVVTKPEAKRKKVQTGTKPKPEATTLGFDWVIIPAGEFMYGNDKKRIYLDAYRISRTPVTNRQYKVFVDVTGYAVPKHWKKYGKIPNGKEDHPVLYVAWDDAHAFCSWASVSLPTEQQWEKAARGIDGREYPWGNQLPTTQLCNCDGSTTTPVGRYSPQGDSPYGVADMAGNVWEWCDGWYDEKYKIRPLRGGSWFSDYNPHEYLRCASRRNGNPSGWVINRGFRVVSPGF